MKRDYDLEYYSYLKKTFSMIALLFTGDFIFWINLII